MLEERVGAAEAHGRGDEAYSFQDAFSGRPAGREHKRENGPRPVGLALKQGPLLGIVEARVVDPLDGPMVV